MHRVDPNSELAQLNRQGVRQSDDAELARTVVPATRHGLDARRRADGDDRSAVARLDHRWHDGLDRIPQAGQVDVDDVLPLLRRNLPKPTPIEHAGVGDHDVETAELLDRVGHHALLAGEIADVDLFGADLSALAFDEAHRL